MQLYLSIFKNLPSCLHSQRSIISVSIGVAAALLLADALLRCVAGQTRKVQVTRITIEGTVEERILALQRRKQEMVESAFGEGGSGGGGQGAARLTQQDLEFLFTA